MKIFISHQKADAALATQVAMRLKIQHSIEYYLDVIDPISSKTGDELGDYIRAQLGSCDQLLAVVSDATRNSWWVPWEIGVASEKDYPISTYCEDRTELPTYLKKWPYLKNQTELDLYAKESKQLPVKSRNRIIVEHMTATAAKRMTTSEFHRNLKTLLGQT